MKPLLVSMAETRQLIGVGMTRLYEMVNANEIETVRIGRRRLVKFASLEALIGKGEQ